MSEVSDAYQRLYDIIVRLRSPGGCPWDIEQTPSSMRGDLLEEAFEAAEAIDEGKPAHICEELGDVFLNTTMIGYMHEQEGLFTVADALDQVSDKLIRRHPHVFGGSKAENSAQVLDLWDTIKRDAEGRQTESVLDEVSKGLPPLTRAFKLQKKASKKGFDWASVDDVWVKVREELDEAVEAASDGVSAQNRPHIEEEIGDLLFAVVNAARHLGVDPVLALTGANAKFTRRFRYVESRMKESGLPMDSEHLADMDAFWDVIREQDKKRSSD